MKYVTCMGMLYRLKNSDYVDMMRSMAAGKDWDIDAKGKCLGYVKNVTDLTAAQAAEELEDLEKQGGNCG